VFVIKLERRREARGFFARQWCSGEFARAGLDPRVAQINTARSVAGPARRQPNILSYASVPNSMTSLAACYRAS
jgi:hypothetical protein